MQPQLKPEERISSTEKQALRRQLDEYYGSVSDYTAYLTPTNQVHCWEHVRKAICERLDSTSEVGGVIDVLEVGASRSGFGKWLTIQQLRHRVCWTAHDVTVLNVSWLESRADEVVYGDVSVIPGSERFDVVFSTYVLEHVANPRAHLDFLLELLCPGGSLLLFSPR
jgi:2-polyprenyl-3-methyl-5-hydroxy-6-metoxy-1,4-benzoquinol methylase